MAATVRTSRPPRSAGNVSAMRKVMANSTRPIVGSVSERRDASISSPRPGIPGRGAGVRGNITASPDQSLEHFPRAIQHRRSKIAGLEIRAVRATTRAFDRAPRDRHANSRRVLPPVGIRRSRSRRNTGPEDVGAETCTRRDYDRGSIARMCLPPTLMSGAAHEPVRCHHDPVGE